MRSRCVFFMLPFPAMRLAQITDLHARDHLAGSAANTDRESRRMGELLRRAIARCRAEGADALAVTGDLLDVPLWLYQPMRGFELDAPAWWRDAAIADYRMLKRILDDGGLPYLVVPGNHDIAAWMHEVFDSSPAANELTINGLRLMTFVDHEDAGHVPRRYHPTRHRWLDALGDAGNDTPQVHLQHYVVTPDCNARYPHTYADAASLLQRNAASGRVRLSLSGHYHAGTGLLAHGGVSYATCPAFCEPPFPFRLYDVHGERDAPISMQAFRLGADAVPRRRVVFVDRDGVVTLPGRYYFGPERITLAPGAAAAIRRLNDADVAVVAISNQANVGMGFAPRAIMNAVNDKVQRLLWQQAGAVLDRVYASTDAGERNAVPGYRDRVRPKPDPHMMQQAVSELNLDPAGACFIGDRVSDGDTAANFGIQPVLVRTGLGGEQEAGFSEGYPDAPVHDDLAAAIDAWLA